MRKLGTAAVGLAFVLGTTGCALRDREWGGCAVGGAVIGAAVGGITGGVAANNTEGDDAERGGAIGGGIVGGAALGALLGHAICDPIKEAPPPPPPPPPAPPAKGEVLGTVGAAHFDFDRANLKPSAAQALAGAVQKLKEHPSVRVVVEGHTDSVGSEAYNQRLSERRADAVKNYLVDQGIDAGRIETRGHGKSKPIASNSTAEGRAQNRRAEIIVL